MINAYFKNIQFSRFVKTEGQVREFNFRRHSDEKGRILFSVDVCDSRNNRVMFSMHQQDNVWKIIQNDLPDWIMLYEKNFHELIEAELSNVPKN